MSADVSPYTALITQEHSTQPNFMLTVTVSVQPWADIRGCILDFFNKFDIDQAAGVQLDIIGQWIGLQRPVGEGDATYAILLKAKILANQWDGTKDGAYAVWNAIFANNPDAPTILIQDNGDMTITYALFGGSPDPTFVDLFVSGQLSVKSAGVMITGFYTQSDTTIPYFGYDVENASISGYDVGQWPIENGV